jgi:NTE family protein
MRRLDAQVQERLVNWGYAICDAGLRKHCGDFLQREYGISVSDPQQLPYPASGI